MNQQSRLILWQTNRRWLVGLVLLVALFVTQAAHAIGVRIIYGYVPTQSVDLDGDGQRETFSATMRIYDDGTADGLLILGDELQVELSAGSASCVDDVAVAEAYGTLYQVENGNLIEIGTVIASARPVGGGGGGDITDLLFDIVDSATDSSSQGGRDGGGGGDITDVLFDIVDSVTGTLNFRTNPCATAVP